MGPELFKWFPFPLPPGAAAATALSMGVPLSVLNSVFDLGLPEGIPGSGDVLRPFGIQVVGSIPIKGEGRGLASQECARLESSLGKLAVALAQKAS